MIQELTLSNFRTHSDSKFTFSPGVNIITGKSDSGKSNVIRALNWIAKNRPLGENVVQHGKEQTFVQLVIEDKGNQIGITRSKGKNHNEYILSMSGKEDISFTAFGTHPPEPILDALNLSDINIQKQKEQYFLVFDSPGPVATYIRSITRLDEVDLVVKSLKSKILTKKNAVANSHANLEEAEKELEELSKIDLDRLEKNIAMVNSFLVAEKEILAKQQELSSFLSELKEIERSIIHLPINVDEVLQSCVPILELHSEVSDRKQNLILILNELKEIETDLIHLPINVDEVLQSCIPIIESYFKISDKERVLTLILNELREIKLYEIDIPEGIDNIIQQYVAGYEAIDETIEELQSIVDGLIHFDREQLELQKEIDLLVVEKQSLEEKLEVCPSCGTDLDETSKQHLLNHTG